MAEMESAIESVGWGVSVEWREVQSSITTVGDCLRDPVGFATSPTSHAKPKGLGPLKHLG